MINEIVVAIDGTGDFTTINEAIKKAPKNCKILVKPGIYEEQIIIDKHLVLEGIPNENNELPQIFMDKGLVCSITEYAEIKFIQFRNNFKLSHKKGTQKLTNNLKDLNNKAILEITSNAKLFNCIISNSYFCGIIIGFNSNTSINECTIYSNADSNIVIKDNGNPKIESCNIYGSSNSGIIFTNKSRGHINNCKVYHNESSNIIVMDDADPVINNSKIYNSVKNNCIEFKNNAKGFIQNCSIYKSLEENVVLSDFSNPYFDKCEIFKSKEEAGIFISDFAKGKFENCRIYNNFSTNVELYKNSNPIFNFCEFREVRGDSTTNVRIRNYTTSVFRNCKISGGEGIEIHGIGANPLIENCKIHDVAFGIEASSNSYGHVKKCEIYNIFDNAALHFEYCSFPIIEDCKIYNGQSYGLLFQNKTSATIKNCKVYDMADDAFHTEDESLAKIENCFIGCNDTIKDFSLFAPTIKDCFITYNNKDIKTITEDDVIYKENEEKEVQDFVCDNNDNYKELPNVVYPFTYGKELEEIELPTNVENIAKNAFKGHSNLKKIIIPDSVLEINKSAFENCDKLEVIELPHKLKYIGGCAFKGCSSLKKITIPDSVSEINTSAFENCDKLEVIVLPHKLECIGESTFKGCSSLKKIILPEGFLGIWESTFENCEKLEEIELPPNLEYIEKSAFKGCSSLKKITIPDSVLQINASAFLDCEKLEKIVLPPNLQYIEDFTFAGCLNLKEITISDSVDKIGDGVFSCCENLEEINIPRTVTEIGLGVFSGCINLVNINFDPNYKYYKFENGLLLSKNKKILLCCLNREEDVVIPEGITTIEREALSSCKNLKSLKLPNSLQVLENGSLGFIKNIKKIEIPSSIKQICSWAFSGSSVEEITFYENFCEPKVITNLEMRAFADCEQLKRIELSNNITEITEFCFIHCPKLEVITIPPSVQKIGISAFHDCTSLKEINLNNVCHINIATQTSFDSLVDSSYTHDRNTSIDGVFSGCSSLKTIKVDNNYLSDINGVLYNKDKTCLITVPPAYENKLIIPEYTELISPTAFIECKNISFIEVDKKNKNLSSKNGILIDNNKNTILKVPAGMKNDIQIPDNVKFITYKAFEGCHNIVNIKIPKTVEMIELHAFDDCVNLNSIEVDIKNIKYTSLDGLLYSKDMKTLITVPEGKTGSIILPDGVKNILWSAFYKCTNITDVYIPESVLNISSTAFQETNIQIHRKVHIDI